jgi:hypothetical protein
LRAARLYITLLDMQQLFEKFHEADTLQLQNMKNATKVREIAEIK